MVAYGFKRQFVEPIMVGLGLDIGAVHSSQIPRPKRQTIRAVGERRHVRPGEEIQLYTAMRTKQCRLIGRARCTHITAIRIDVGPQYLTVVIVPTAGLFNQISHKNMEEFAAADGFKSSTEMHAFWRKEHGEGPFSGVLIQWEPIP